MANAMNEIELIMKVEMSAALALIVDSFVSVGTHLWPVLLVGPRGLVTAPAFATLRGWQAFYVLRISESM